MTDFLDEKHVEIRTRLEELRPLVDEYHRLTAAAEALGDIAKPEASPNGRKGPGRPRGSKNLKTSAKTGKRPAAGKRIAGKAAAGNASAAKPAGKKRGRPKGSGSRTAGAL